MKYVSNLFKGRINRRNFLLSVLFFNIAFFLISFLFDNIFYNLPSSFSDIAGILSLVFFVISVIPAIFYISVFVRRMHDLGWSVWYFILLLLIPLVNLFVLYCLFLKGGQERDNKFGNKPNQKIRFPADVLNLNSKDDLFHILEHSDDQPLLKEKRVEKNGILLKIIFFTIVVISLPALFYWYEIRPSTIRSQCSWVPKHSETIPGRPAMTEQELSEKGLIRKCDEATVNNNPYLNALAESFKDLCESGNMNKIKEYSQPIATIEAKDWFEKANRTQYEFCIRSKGLGH